MLLVMLVKIRECKVQTILCIMLKATIATLGDQI